MAEKKQEFQYGSAFLPEGEKKYSVIRWGWNGLNREDKIDTGQLTDMSGMLCDPPYMEPAKKAKTAIDFQNGIPVRNQGDIWTPVSSAPRHSGTPISIDGNFIQDTVVSLIWRDENTGKITLSRYAYWPQDLSATYPHGWYVMGEFQLGTAGLADESIPRTILLFNAVDTSSGNIAAYTYDRKQLVYPDRYSVPTTASGSAASFNTQSNPVPYLKFATVYNSRVFGVTDDDLVVASAYNSYVDYSLDTADDVSSAHAWASMAGSNTDASGSVTAMTTYGNHVVIWRRDFMQLVYNNKNPFRIVDVGRYGCENNKAWVILNGVLYFASSDKVYAYTGGTPKEISGKLDAGDLTGATLGGFGDRVWMQTKDSLYTYNTKSGAWSDVGLAPFGGFYQKIKQFATLDYGLVALVDTNPANPGNSFRLYIVDWNTELMGLSEDAAADWNPEYQGTWYFITDLMALGRLDVRRVKKFSMLCEGNAGATVSVYLLKDGKRYSAFMPDELCVGTFTFDKKGFHKLRVLTRQFSADMHQLYFTGSGYVKVYAAELKVAWGGDLYVES